MNDKAPVYVADTCIGGLSVLRSLWEEQVACNATFLADYAINPLGVKSDSVIANVVARWIERASVVADTLVIACNTLSIRYAQMAASDRSAAPTLNVVTMVDCFDEMVKREAGQLANKAVLVVGTAFTARQPLYSHIVNRVLPDARVDTIAATELERKIARFEPWDGATDAALTAELTIAMAKADVVILACTCFPMVMADLEALFPDVVFLDPGAYCAVLLANRHNAQHKTLSVEVTGNEVPATSVISFAKSFLDGESIDLYRSQ